jgi:hypothetical protein
MTRALSVTMWRRFYVYLFVRVVFDFAWELLIYENTEFKVIESWLQIDGASMWFILGIVVFGRKPVLTSWVGALIIIAISVFDYYNNWYLYFPFATSILE